jgi:hypothetical protein
MPLCVNLGRQIAQRTIPAAAEIGVPPSSRYRWRQRQSGLRTRGRCEQNCTATALESSPTVRSRTKPLRGESALQQRWRALLRAFRYHAAPGLERSGVPVLNNPGYPEIAALHGDISPEQRHRAGQIFKWGAYCYCRTIKTKQPLLGIHL